ncbi:MAG TPA: extracellular solute-binding protein, partial [Aestuariivirga sp.]|nr:extracellular solute-binding protein [Aestuariivirga sp.]
PRRFIKLAAAPLAVPAFPWRALAQDRSFTHALTLFSDIKYPADFKQFDYVNGAAPKGGVIRVGVVGSFDSLNPYTFKGEAAAAAPAETLMTRSLDEPATQYGLLAGEVWHPEDRSMVVFRLRPEARFHDGSPVTAEDVAWSMMTLKEVNPRMAAYYHNVVKAEVTGAREVTFIFSEKGNREMPSITSELPVLSRAWWTGKDAAGKARNIAEIALEPPLTSGPYRVADFKPGASISLERVKDYWGERLPVNVGQNNFDRMEIIYFRDANVALEAFKADQYDYRVESSSKMWATGYDIPAVKDGRCIKTELTFRNVNGMQGYVFNLRRDKFKDVRVRRAFNLAFDFEWANANLFYGQYTRSRSFFNKSDMEAKGLPSPEELALLEPLKADLPPEVFTTEYQNPVNATPQDRRKNLREAADLLAQAGWTITSAGGRNLLKNARGEPFTVEFLLDSPLFERITLPFQKQLEMLGFTVNVRTVDSTQYERQRQTFDFDMVVNVWGESLSPGNEQRGQWGSAAADQAGSDNLAGLKNAAIDRLIEAVIFATDRAALTTACKALDRALAWTQFVVPHWYSATTRLAYWNRFGMPDTLPEYDAPIPSGW